MRKLLFVAIFLPVVMSSCRQSSDSKLIFTNSLDIMRENEVVQINFDEITELLGEFRDDQLPLFLSGSDTLITQFINYQGDELPEEILVEISLAPTESKNVEVAWTDKASYPEFPYKTSLHFARHSDHTNDLETATRLQSTESAISWAEFQMEGPAWENDKVGFRNYFDLRNGMDIYGKTTSDMVLSHVGLKEGVKTPDNYNFDISYHELSDWGMDVLKVGNSLGAGSLAIEKEDSLFRVGDNGKGNYEKLYEGPLKSEYKFGFPDWKAVDETIGIDQYVSIEAGKYCFKSSQFLENQHDDVSFVTGIVNKHSEELIEYNAGKEHMAFITHSKQSEDGNYLSMAIMVNKNDLISSGETADSGPGITETYYIKLKTKSAEASDYRFYALWATSNPDFAELDNVKTLLNQDALKLENPVKVESR